jgi:hypothetical protein
MIPEYSPGEMLQRYIHALANSICVIAIIQAGQKGGLRSKMGPKDSYSGLANRTLCRCLRPRLAMYLDKYVCLNSLDRDSQDSCHV